MIFVFFSKPVVVGIAVVVGGKAVAVEAVVGAHGHSKQVKINQSV